MVTEHAQTNRRITADQPSARALPWSGTLLLPAGLAVVAVAWSVAWFGPEPARWYTFFPLWLGYILTVDGLTVRLTGTSYLTTAPRVVAGMFLVSMPCWWVFEALNRRLDNWHYQLPVDYGRLSFSLLASLAFSTVIPAVLGTAALYRSLGVGRSTPISSGAMPLSTRRLQALVLIGLIMLALVIVVPRQAFPLAWLSLVFIVDPINAMRGNESLFIQFARKDWSRILPLSMAGLTCGVFWELWNYWSMPKWTYDVPYVGFWPVFEMPILGYGGYVPFAWELFAVWTLAGSVIARWRAPRAVGRFRPI